MELSASVLYYAMSSMPRSAITLNSDLSGWALVAIGTALAIVPGRRRNPTDPELVPVA